MGNGINEKSALDTQTKEKVMNNIYNCNHILIIQNPLYRLHQKSQERSQMHITLSQYERKHVISTCVKDFT